MHNASNTFARLTTAAILMGLAMGAGLDATASVFGQMSELVPIPFRSKSWIVVANARLSVDDVAAASTATESAVLSRPLDASAYVMLAEVRARQNNGVGEPPLAVAAQLGWRNVDVQRAIVIAATESSAWAVAAPRIVALSRTGNLDSLPSDLLSEGRIRNGYKIIHRIFAGNFGYWLQFFVWLNRSNLVDGDEFLATMPGYAKRADCGSVVTASNIAAGQGRLSVADAILDENCSDFAEIAGAGLAFKGNFGSSGVGPFDWKFSFHPAVAFEKISKGSEVYIASTNVDAVARPFATKVVKLKGEKYKLYVSALSRNEGSSAISVALSFQCISQKHGSSPRVITAVANKIFFLDGDNCGYERVTLYVLKDNPFFNVHILPR